MIPSNISDDVIFDILKRASRPLTSDIIYIDDDALKDIVDNLFTFPNASKLQLQEILTLLKLKRFSTNIRVGTTIWLKIANSIADNVGAYIDSCKDVIYGYLEWLVINSRIDQVSIT